MVGCPFRHSSTTDHSINIQTKNNNNESFLIDRRREAIMFLSYTYISRAPATAFSFALLLGYAQVTCYGINIQHQSWLNRLEAKDSYRLRG